MFSEIIKATLMGALPVAAFTFLVLQWSIASGRFSGFDDEEDLGKQFKKKIKEKKEAQKQARAAEKAARKEAKKTAPENNTDETEGEGPSGEKHPNQQEDNTDTETEPKAHMARRFAEDALHNTFTRFGAGFYGTMAMITYLLIEVDEIFTFLGKLADLSWQLPDFFSLFIDFLINSLMNFIAALVWFVTLQDYLPIEMGFVWLVAAYLGYLAGERITASYGDELWDKLKQMITNVWAWAIKLLKDTFKISKSTAADDTNTKHDK